MKYLKPTMVVFGVTICMIILIGLMQAFGWLYDGFGMWFTSIAMGITAIAVIVSFFGQKFNWRKIGFYVLHMGLILFLLGQLIYATTGQSIQANYSVHANNWYGQITVDGENQPLDFTFQIKEMKVEYYDPIYDVYRMSDSKLMMSDVDVGQGGICDFGKYGRVSVVGSDGNLQDQVKLSGDFAAVKRQPVKHYEGTILYNKPGKNTKTLNIEVNKTLRMGKYKVFLMAYNANTRQVTLLFKNDYGEPFSIIGILMLIVGTIYTCLLERFVNEKLNQRKRKAALAAKQAESDGGDVQSTESLADKTHTEADKTSDTVDGRAQQ